MSARVLVTHANTNVRGELRESLEKQGFEVQEATETTTAVALALSSSPDAIVLDATRGSEASEILSRLRADFRTSLVPIVFLAECQPSAEDIGGADDYVLPPFEAAEVAARVAVTLQRSAALRGVNPLTGLPGNTVIGEEMAARLKRGDSFACSYIDLDHFKAYNDRYGFTRGDDVIRALARCLVAALTEHGTAGCFAGHVGGDDFVVLTPPEEAEPVAKTLCERFTTEVYKLYEPAVRRRGWVEVKDRRGRPVKVPLCTVSIGIVHSDRSFETSAEMAEAAAEVKGVAKREPTSSWAVDRRKQ